MKSRGSCARGLVPVSRLTRIGPNYVVQATDRNGDLKRVMVDAAYGDSHSTARRPRRRSPHGRARPRRLTTPNLPLPPA
jgi:hypothetical protein